MSACENHRVDSVTWLISKGVNVNASMSTGWTALHAAAKVGATQCIQVLMQHGANQDVKAKHRNYGKDKTACQVANMEGKADVVAVLERYREGQARQCVSF